MITKGPMILWSFELYLFWKNDLYVGILIDIHGCGTLRTKKIIVVEMECVVFSEITIIRVLEVYFNYAWKILLD